MIRILLRVIILIALIIVPGYVFLAYRLGGMSDSAVGSSTETIFAFGIVPFVVLLFCFVLTFIHKKAPPIRAWSENREVILHKAAGAIACVQDAKRRGAAVLRVNSFILPGAMRSAVKESEIVLSAIAQQEDIWFKAQRFIEEHADSRSMFEVVVEE